MLHEFLIANRSELIRRCRGKVAARRAPHATPAELEHGVPLFLDQVTAMLAHPHRDLLLPPPPGTTVAESHMNDSATRHGEELRRHSYTIEQVVHDYGDLCQAITELAHEQRAPVTLNEFGMLSIRLDNAIASAVAAFALPREVPAEVEGSRDDDRRLGVLAGEMRDALDAAILAVTEIRAGSIGFGGATAAALDSSLVDMRAVIDRTLAECGRVR
jgi:hypothetical protein